jgi:hypothetical protein
MMQFVALPTESQKMGAVMRLQKWAVGADFLEFSHSLLLQIPDDWPIAELSLLNSPLPNSVMAFWRREGRSFI